MFSKLKNLKNHEGFVRYFKNTSWMFAEQGLRMIAGLLVGIWVARYLGPEQFGLFSYVLAFTAIFGCIAKLGLDGILVRELVNVPEKRDVYLGTAFWLKVAGALFVMGLMAAIMPFTGNDNQTNLFIFIIAIGLLFQSFEVVEFYFQSEVMAKIVSLCKVTQLAVSSIIKIYLVVNEADLIDFVIVITVDALILTLSYTLAYKITKNSFFWGFFNWVVAKKFLRDSWPLILSAIVVTIYMRVDQMMIKEIMGEYEVGIYSAAVRLSEAFYFIPMLITVSIFPAVLSAKKISEDLYHNRLQRLYTLMVWIAIATALPITLLSDWIVTLLFGQVYHPAAEVLVVHVWASIFVFLGVASGKWYMSENLMLLSFYRTLSGVLVNVFLNAVFIPKFGIIGAATSTLFSQFIAGYFFDYLHPKTKPVFFAKSKAFLLKGIF